MSGYDALDELYERLRGTEDAQRAGGITPETIRAARGGVADGYGRECHVVDENAADGDSAPLAGDSRDSRERIEADAWEAARLDMSKTWEERRDAIVALLDRQAALTEREWDSATASRRIVELRKKVNALAVERDELQAKLDEYGQTHMPLPVDADGVLIHMGDELYNGEVIAFGGLAEGGVVFVHRGFEDGNYILEAFASNVTHHVKPRTVENVLFEFWHEFGREVEWKELEGRISEYAAELRELMGSDGE